MNSWENFRTALEKLEKDFERSLKELWEKFKRRESTLRVIERTMNELWKNFERILKELWKCLEITLKNLKCERVTEWVSEWVCDLTWSREASASKNYMIQDY